MGAQQLWLSGSGALAQQLWHVGLVAQQHVGSSWIRNQTHVSCVGRHILYRWATRETQRLFFFNGDGFLVSIFQIMIRNFGGEAEKLIFKTISRWLWYYARLKNYLFQPPMQCCGASLVAQRLKCLPAMWETWVRSLGREDPLEKEMATHSSILAWRIPWTGEPGGLHQSMGSQRVKHDWATSLLLPYAMQ